MSKRRKRITGLNGRRYRLNSAELVKKINLMGTDAIATLVREPTRITIVITYSGRLMTQTHSVYEISEEAEAHRAFVSL